MPGQGLEKTWQQQRRHEDEIQFSKIEISEWCVFGSRIRFASKQKGLPKGQQCFVFVCFDFRFFLLDFWISPLFSSRFSASTGVFFFLPQKRSASQAFWPPMWTLEKVLVAVRIAWPSMFESESLNNYSLEVNIAPENIPSQKESRLPAHPFSGKEPCS